MENSEDAAQFMILLHFGKSQAPAMPGLLMAGAIEWEELLHLLLLPVFSPAILLDSIELPAILPPYSFLMTGWFTIPAAPQHPAQGVVLITTQPRGVCCPGQMVTVEPGGSPAMRCMTGWFTMPLAPQQPAQGVLPVMTQPCGTACPGQMVSVVPVALPAIFLMTC
jgi:hypothetical protein